MVMVALKCSEPGSEELWNVFAERVCHLATADVCDAVKRQVDVHGRATGQIVLDRLHDQLHQLAVRTEQN